MTADEWIEKLRLAPHPEGGWYCETWRSEVVLPPTALPPGYDGPRNAGTSIYFLLRAGEASRAHRVRSDEIWIVVAGDGVRLDVAPQGGDRLSLKLGLGARDGLQAVVPGGAWQAAVPLEGPDGFVLCVCVVVPGFDFADFELGEMP